MLGYKIFFGAVTAISTAGVILAEGGLEISELKQAPMLVAVVLIVLAFLKYLTSQTKAQAGERERHMQTMKEMGAACHSVQSDHVLQIRSLMTESQRLHQATMKATDDNTRVTQQAIRVLERVEKKFE